MECTDEQYATYKRINREYECALKKSKKMGTYARDVASLTEKWICDFAKHGFTQEIQDACQLRDSPTLLPQSVQFKRF
jgi:hypothetical protein